MNTRTKYKTRQREQLMGYFETVSGRRFTAADVCAYCRTQGIPIGQATVYRQLENLVDEGILNKYVIDANSPACFEYVPADSHREGDTCYHCKCEKCGKLIHLQCGEIEELQAHLLAGHHFRLDARRTVFYGLCEDCI